MNFFIKAIFSKFEQTAENYEFADIYLQLEMSSGKELHFSILNRPCLVNKKIHIFSCK